MQLILPEIEILLIYCKIKEKSIRGVLRFPHPGHQWSVDVSQESRVVRECLGILVTISLPQMDQSVICNCYFSMITSSAHCTIKLSSALVSVMCDQ